MNCIIAQSGGPTSVINGSLMGVLAEALASKRYHKVLAGVNGIQGILEENIVDISHISVEEREKIKNTPAAIVGSCRYKLKSYTDDKEQYDKLFNIFNKYEIGAFFYIGGNDSMDTVRALSKYAKENNIDFRAVGIPKTIDNDLEVMDHTPGFSSAAKYINTCIMESYLDDNVYDNKSVIIMETMGREAGWLAASAVAAKIDGKQIVDHIYVPENCFDDMKFLHRIYEGLEKKDKLYIVVSEGIRYENGEFVATSSSNASHDKFGHSQLGGVGQKLRNMILTAGITKRVKSIELGILQRCAIHSVSSVDLEEAYQLGQYAVKFANEGLSGVLPGIIRTSNKPYDYEIKPIPIEKVANNTKLLPKEWIDYENDFIKDEMLEYVEPLMGQQAFIPYMDLIRK